MQYEDPHEESLNRLRGRRLVYFILAILCSIMPLISPVFRFGADQGIIYERSYRMNFSKIVTLLVENTTGFLTVGESMSVLKMNITLCLFILLCVVLFIMNFTYRRYTMWGCYAAVAIGVIYYVMVIDCGVRATDDLCASLTLNWSLFFPALSIELLLMARQNIDKDIKGAY